MDLCVLNVNPGQVSIYFMESLLAEKNYSLVTEQSHVNICHARNKTVNRFIAKEEEWALFLDSDMVFKPGTFGKLVQSAQEEDTYVMGGFCSQPSGKLLLTYPDGTYRNEYPNHPIETGPTGLGCLLVHKEVLGALSDNTGLSWFQEKVDGMNWVSEDINFCQKIMEAGFKIYVNPLIPIGHHKGNKVYYP